jgi:hypothetical protein
LISVVRPIISLQLQWEVNDPSRGIKLKYTTPGRMPLDSLAQVQRYAFSLPCFRYTWKWKMFIDEARIRVKAGDGGNGCMAFRREKFVPRGGPSGGDGGHGADVLMSSSLSHNTLVHFRFNPEHKAERGGHGLGSNCSGAAGEPITLNVPVGTLLFDDATGELVHDFSRAGETIVIARGGRGGRGNQHFATSTHQAPREHELGRSGEERAYRLELRLLADAGLVGYPNVGKSTLISRLSAAKPRIADYAFTTLEPNLGVVQVGEFPHTQSFTIADLPGLIEGDSVFETHRADVGDCAPGGCVGLVGPAGSGGGLQGDHGGVEGVRSGAGGEADHPGGGEGGCGESGEVEEACGVRQAQEDEVLCHLCGVGRGD